MRKRRTTAGLTVNAIAGTHVALLGLDLADAQRKGCLGFAIQREDHTEDERYWMRGMKTFKETDPGLGPGGQVSSREHPFQSFQWADYSAKPEHDYTYMLVDPLGDTPVVVTGSANFSEASTNTNNENMVVIRNDPRVADIYVGEFMRLYSHYAFRDAVAIAHAEGDTEWQPNYLVPDQGWQGDYFKAGGQRFPRRRYFAGL